jgi:hypothetical protein
MLAGRQAGSVLHSDRKGVVLDNHISPRHIPGVVSCIRRSFSASIAFLYGIHLSQQEKQKGMKRILLASLLVLVFGFSVMPGVTGAKSANPSTYIVVFHENQDPETAADGLQRQYGVGLGGVYRYALKGAVIHASSQQVVEVEQDDRVLYVEPNQVYSINDAQVIPFGIQRIFADENPYLRLC